MSYNPRWKVPSVSLSVSEKPGLNVRCEGCPSPLTFSPLVSSAHDLGGSTMALLVAAEWEPGLGTLLGNCSVSISSSV